MYNVWFLRFAPDAYRTTRVQTTSDVEPTLKATRNLTDIGVTLLRANPGVLPTLRMATCPPLAVDRLIGLAGVPPNGTGRSKGCCSMLCFFRQLLNREPRALSSHTQEPR